MNRFVHIIFLSLAALSLGAFAKDKATASDPFAGAKELFGQYAKLERAFDPAVADLYSDQAVIRNKRNYPDGNVRTMELPAPKYKELIRGAMPTAKAMGDYSTYSDVTYAWEGQNIRVLATRYSELKKYSGQLSLLVAHQEGGAWLIIEELSESQP